MTTANSLYGSVGAHGILGKIIDHEETYGRHVMATLFRSIPSVETAVDLGAGWVGADIQNLRRIHPKARIIAVEAGQRYAESLRGKADEIHVANIERDALPFADRSIDLFIANQILEHTKEVFWIFNEVTRSLKVGGHFIFGVPNICSLHNRLLMLFGKHPTQHKVCSAHVRPFSKEDTMKFVEACFPAGYHLESFAGSQFYPFPKSIARPLANKFPTAAFTIFFKIRKLRDYNGEFALYPGRAMLETNFWTGANNSQY
jgi:ubiquinone/menaquinone biosynthesis C-methylase UbiE